MSVWVVLFTDCAGQKFVHVFSSHEKAVDMFCKYMDMFESDAFEVEFEDNQYYYFSTYDMSECYIEEHEIDR